MKKQLIVLGVLLAVGAVYAQSRTAERVDRVERAQKVASHGPFEEDCFASDGSEIHLCKMYRENRSADGGLILEFQRSVTNAFFILAGPEAKIELWTRRSDVGDVSKATGVYLPFQPLEEGELWGIGISQTPAYIAARLSGTFVVIEDLVYVD